MRHPTAAATLLAYWKAALAGEAPPVHDGCPECGWYKTKLVKGGPWVAVRIFIDRYVDDETGELVSPEIYRAVVGGESRDPAPIWTFLTAISREEHERLEDARKNNLTMAATHAAIDLTLEPSLP